MLPPFDAEEVKNYVTALDYHFSTVERSAAEDAMLKSEKAGEGHVEFEESDKVGSIRLHVWYLGQTLRRKLRKRRPFLA